MIRLTPAFVTLVILAGCGLLIGAYFVEALRDGSTRVAEVPQGSKPSGEPSAAEASLPRPAVAEVSPTRNVGETVEKREPLPADSILKETIEAIEVVAAAPSEIEPAVAQKPSDEDRVSVIRQDADRLEEAVSIPLEIEFPRFQTEQFRGSRRAVNCYPEELPLP